MGALQGGPLSDLLRIAGLTVRYGANLALDGLNLTVRRGELFVLLGASGSGKTTLLRAIAGFVRPDAGVLELDGRELGALPPHRRPVNTMFQSYALFPHMSVAANIGFGLHQQGRSRAEIDARVAEMLALVSLPGFGARRPHQLSGGQQQRVALARSLAPNPALLLLDEPLSALDRNLRAETRAELVRLQRRLGTSFILVTHDQEEALSLADRIGVMQAGRMAQIGTPAEVYERPLTRFVAEFLGAANVLPAVVRAATAEGVVLALPGLDAVVQASAGHGAEVPVVGETVLLAIRPERLLLRAADAPNRLQGEVVAHGYAGETLTHTLRLADGTLLRGTATLDDGLAAGVLAIGTRVTASWQADACILLRE